MVASKIGRDGCTYRKAGDGAANEHGAGNHASVVANRSVVCVPKALRPSCRDTFEDGMRVELTDLDHEGQEGKGHGHGGGMRC